MFRSVSRRICSWFKGMVLVGVLTLQAMPVNAQQTMDLGLLGLNPDGTLWVTTGNVSPGLRPRDIVNVSQLRTTSRVLADYTDARVDDAINQIDARAQQINNRVDNVKAGANQGVAAVSAMLAAVRTPSPGKSTIGIGGGYYGGQAGMAVGMSHRSRTSRWQSTAAIGVPASMVSGANIAASAGVGIEF